MGIVWDVEPDEMLAKLTQEYTSAIHRGAFLICQRYAPEIESWMKANAPWTDRTGNARQTLNTEVEQVVNQMVSLAFSHGVDYGVYLELDYGGRFAIIGPAMDHFVSKIWNDVQELMR